MDIACIIDRLKQSKQSPNKIQAKSTSQIKEEKILFAEIKEELLNEAGNIKKIQDTKLANAQNSEVEAQTDYDTKIKFQIEATEILENTQYKLKQLQDNLTTKQKILTNTQELVTESHDIYLAKANHRSTLYQDYANKYQPAEDARVALISAIQEQKNAYADEDETIGICHSPGFERLKDRLACQTENQHKSQRNQNRAKRKVDADNDVTNKQNSYNQAQAEYNNAKAAYDNAVSVEATAKANLDSANKAKDEAQNNLNTAQASVANWQINLNTHNNDKKFADDKVNEAKTNLDNAQKAKDLAMNSFNGAISKVEISQKALNDANVDKNNAIKTAEVAKAALEKEIHYLAGNLDVNRDFSEDEYLQQGDGNQKSDQESSQDVKVDYTGTTEVIDSSIIT